MEHRVFGAPRPGVEECREKMASDYQSWAVETAWELYQKRKKEKKS